MIITPIPGKVLVIRTGDGKFARVEILSYYKKAPTTPTSTSEGYYHTFRYGYQPDGSQNLNQFTVHLRINMSHHEYNPCLPPPFLTAGVATFPPP